MKILLDLLFPKKCVGCQKYGSYLCRSCLVKVRQVNPVCPICQRQAIGGKVHPRCKNRYRLDGLIFATRYEGVARKAIMKVKYKWVYAIEELFVDLIVDSFWKFDVPEFDLVVPVPLHSHRRRWRGFNQSEILAKSIADKFSLNYQEILVRIRETKTQVGLKGDERLNNIKGSFSSAKTRSGGKKNIDSKNILLVDDVYTSGATMGEACRELKKAGAGEVWGLAVALG